MLVEKPEGYQERPARRERGERPERGERRQRNDRNERGERRPRPERGERRERPAEQQSELASKLNEKLGEEYHDPMANHEPKDFNDSLDHMDF